MSLLKLRYKSASNPCANGYYPYPSESVYVGRVVRFKYLSDDEFAFTTGDIDAPVRILEKNNIIEAWIDRSNRKDNVTIVDNQYVVTKGAFNRYSCTCTSYHYRKRCNHITEVKAGLKNA